jgi:hypothetical protein
MSFAALSVFRNRIRYPSYGYEDKALKFQNPSSHNKLFRGSFKEFQERTRNAIVPWWHRGYPYRIVAAAVLCQRTSSLLFIRFAIPYRTVLVSYSKKQVGDSHLHHSQDETFQRTGTKETHIHPIVGVTFV